MSKKPRTKAAGLGFWPYLAVAFAVVAAYSVGSAWLAVSERVVRAVMLGCVGACAVLALAVPLQKHLPKWETWIVLILVAGVVLRVGYMVYTPMGLRGHDVVGFGESGHLDYVYQIVTTGKLPQSYEYQFYHPPLNYIFEAIIVKAFTFFDHNPNLELVFEAAKIVPCFASCAVLLVCYSLFREFKLSARASALALGVLAFQPTFFILSASINNDSLMLLFYMLAVLYTVRWYNHPTLKNILVIALAIGLGMSTKLSAMTVAGFTAPVFLLLFIRRIREKNALPMLGQFAAFGAVSLPLGLWYTIRNRIKFHISYRYIYTLSRWNALYCGDVPFAKRFLSFPLRQMLEPLYCQPYTDYNIWVYIAKCAAFGEFAFERSAKVALPLSLSNLLLIALSVLAAVYVILRCKETHFLARFGLLWLWLIQMGSFLMFNLQYPFGCTMDLRYIVPTIIVGAAYLGIALDDLKERNKPLGKVLFYFGAAVIAVVAAASTLFYATSSMG